MLYIIISIRCIKVRSYCLWENRFNLLSLYLWLAIKFKSFVSVLIGCLRFKSQWLVLGESNCVWTLSNFPKHFVVLFQFLLLFFSEILFVNCISLERKWVKWVLRVLFMENISLTILPIWETLRIATQT